MDEVDGKKREKDVLLLPKPSKLDICYIIAIPFQLGLDK